jgi:transposase
MLSLNSNTRVYLALGPTDLRKGFSGLYGEVKQKLKEDPVSGHYFVFCNRSKTSIKVLAWDGSGLWVCAKRLERGRFDWPDGSGSGCIRSEQLVILLNGLAPTTHRYKNWYRRK